MTDATNRKLDVDRRGKAEIARDDPLFELSQIIGYSQPQEPEAPVAPVSDDPIDLEQELMRELENYPGYGSASQPEPQEQVAPDVHVEPEVAYVAPDEMEPDAPAETAEIYDFGQRAESEGETYIEPAPDLDFSAEFDQEFELNLANELASDPEAEVAAEPEYAVEPELRTEPELRSEFEPEPTVAFDPEPEYEQETVYETAGVPEAEPEAEQEPAPDLQAFSYDGEDALAEEPVDAPAEAGQPDADTLEAELMALLGGLGGKAAPAGKAESPAPPPAPVFAPVAPEPEPVQAEVENPQEFDEEPPQEPVAPPFWFEERRAQGQEEPSELAVEDRWDEPADDELLASFESELSGGLDLALEEHARDDLFEDEQVGEEPQAQYEADEAYEDASYPEEEAPAVASAADDEMSFSLDLDDEDEPLEQPLSADEEAALREVELVAGELAGKPEAGPAPILDTAEMPIDNVEAMAPLDLPDVEVAEERRRGDVDIERELDVALSGYDRYEDEAAAAPPVEPSAETSLDFDMGTFEEDLARDLEFVDHDLTPREVDEIFSDFEEEASAADVAAASAAPRKPRRGMMIAAVVGGIAVIGAAGAFGLARLDSTGSSEPVLVKADPDPVKIVPDDPGGKQVPNQDRAVYGEVDGNGETAPTQETLVSTSEEPIDLNGAPLPSGVTETGKGEDRLLPDGSQELASAAQDGESPTSLLTPRRVRTVIVKPDGSFIATEPPTPIPAAPRTVETPDNSGASEAVASSNAADPAAPAARETASAPAANANAAENSALQQMANARPATQTEPAPQAAAPAVREPIRAPASIPDRPTNQPVTIATAQPAASSGYTVQIASQPSAELAQKTAEQLSRRFANILGGRAITIQTAQIEGRGTYHRVRVSASSRQDAAALCEAYKQAGGSCFVAR